MNLYHFAFAFSALFRDKGIKYGMQSEVSNIGKIMEDNLDGRRPQWKMNLMEDDLK